MRGRASPHTSVRCQEWCETVRRPPPEPPASRRTRIVGARRVAVAVRPASSPRTRTTRAGPVSACTEPPARPPPRIAGRHDDPPPRRSMQHGEAGRSVARRLGGPQATSQHNGCARAVTIAGIERYRGLSPNCVVTCLISESDYTATHSPLTCRYPSGSPLPLAPIERRVSTGSVRQFIGGPAPAGRAAQNVGSPTGDHLQV